MQLAVRWTVLSALLTGVLGLRLINSQFPSHVIRGNSLNISCDYDANGQLIYQVKWYKDDHEFYRYMSGMSGRTFHIPGVNVNEERSTSRNVLLESADRATEGTYLCEVTTDLTFDTAIASGSVTVVDLPQRGPVITGAALDSMDEGDRVWVNCTAYRSRPAAQLTWYINGARSYDSLLRRYPSEADEEGLYTVTLGLDFRLHATHFDPTGQLTLKCTAEIETVFYQSADLRITSRTMAMGSRFGADCNYRCCGADRKGTCPTKAEVKIPESTVRSSSSQCESKCSDDLLCPYGMKCCQLGCSSRCMPVCMEGCWQGETCTLQFNDTNLERAQCV